MKNPCNILPLFLKFVTLLSLNSDSTKKVDKRREVTLNLVLRVLSVSLVNTSNRKMYLLLVHIWRITWGERFGNIARPDSEPDTWMLHCDVLSSVPAEELTWLSTFCHQVDRALLLFEYPPLFSYFDHLFHQSMWSIRKQEKPWNY